MKIVPTRPKTFAQAEGVLREALPGYTERPQQQALAAFIEDIIKNGGHGLAEAGCGTGKSLAAMIPAILSGKKTVLATATIALQEQYANKDVPFLQDHLGVPFTFALVKGRSNYLCRAKVNDPDVARKVPNLGAMLAEIEADPTHTGDREHFAVEVTKEDFSWVTSTSDDCPGKKQCPFGDICFAEAAKQRGKEAQVVVTNTAMLMTDLKVRELTDGNVAMLGDYDLVVIDEGHETEEIATSALAADIRYNGISKLVGEALTFAQAQGVSLNHDNAVMVSLGDAWKTLEDDSIYTTSRRPLRFFVDNGEPFMALIEALYNFSDEIADISITHGDLKEESKRTRLARRAASSAEKLVEAVIADDSVLVRWVEEWTSRRGETSLILKTAPVHVGAYLDQLLWSRVPSVLISATLSVGDDFSYIADRLGMPAGTETLSVGTPFDYDKQALLFVPDAKVPGPSKERAAWLTWSGVAMQELIGAAGGGALLLFTSRDSMKAAHAALSPWLEAKGINAYIQGQGSNKVLAERFSADTDSVLFALKSFMTGVDFQGETCRLVIIDKLPFAVPDDPIISARQDEVERVNGPRTSFNLMTIPSMTLTLEQAYGRLIRTTADKGVVAILDSRLSSTGYGRKIVDALPTSPRTTSFEEVRGFYA